MTDENPELEDIPIDRTEAFNNLGAAVAAFIDLGMRQLKPGAEAAVTYQGPLGNERVSNSEY